MHQITWFWPPKLKNFPTVGGGGGGDTPLPHPPPAWSLRSLAFSPTSWKPSPPPPTFEDLSTPLDETISAATPLHCLAMTLLSNCPNLQKVGHDIVIFNGNVLGHAWHTWCNKYTNGRRMSCSLFICRTQIFKSIDFRTMGLWIWITFFFYIRTV